MSTYGSHPEQMTVKLTLGDGAHLVATSANGWAGPVSLVWGPDDGVWTEATATLTDVGTVDGTEVSWTLTAEQVTARAAFPYVRLVDNGMTMQAGEVITWRGGLGSTVTQTIASLTAGPPGPTAVSADADNVATLGSDGLIYVSPADAGGFSDAAVAAFVDDTGSSTYASILAGFAATDDPRLSDARTPTAHATSHASGGSDPVTPASIGAATPAQVASGDSATLSAAQSHAQGLVDALTAASPATLDTLAEIAAALGEDPNFAATMTAALANRVRFDAAQSLTVGEQAQARSNIGAGTSSFSGDYGDLDNKPTLGDAAAKNTGTTAGTVAAGDDSRITGAAQKAANLSDLADAATARTNLGLGTAATTDADDYATAAQGALADTALQVATPQPINAQTGAYTLVAADAGKMVKMTLTAAADLTVPANVFTAGQRVDIADRGTARVTVLAGAGMTVNPPAGGSLVMEGQYSAASLFFWSATEADLIGLVAAS